VVDMFYQSTTKTETENNKGTLYASKQSFLPFLAIFLQKPRISKGKAVFSKYLYMGPFK